MKQPLNELSTALLKRYAKKAKASKNNLKTKDRYHLNKDWRYLTKEKKEKTKNKLNKNARQYRNRDEYIAKAETLVRYDNDPAVKQFPNLLGRKTANSNKGKVGRPKSQKTKMSARMAQMAMQESLNAVPVLNSLLEEGVSPEFIQSTILQEQTKAQIYLSLMNSLLEDKPADATVLFEHLLQSKLQERINDYKEVIAETMFDGGEEDEDEEELPDDDSEELEIEDSEIDLDNLTDEELEELLNSIDDDANSEETEQG